jgi:GntR family transcriptional regulator/MocR family aminotransferase
MVVWGTRVVWRNGQLQWIRYDHYDRGVKKRAGAYSPVIAVDRRAGKPLHRQIYDGLRAAIASGSLRAGQQIPSTRALTAELGISRIPLLNAYAQLLAEGYLESRAGTGTFVSMSLPGEATAWDRPVVTAGARPVSRRSQAVRMRERDPWLYEAGAFSVGQLAYDHFPFQAWSRQLARHARKVHASSLNYGDSMGLRGFRETIAEYLRTARGVRCEARQIMVVSGSQQALDICARVLLDAGSKVWVEDPGYGFLRSALMLAGCKLVPVPVDEEGLDVAAGVRMGRRAQAAWVTPSHQYPLGVTMSAARRFQLLEWARGAGAWIVEDDYDSEYRYESMPIASLQGLDRDARVIYVGTFSKTLFPSLRLGYLVIPTDLVDRFVAVRRVTDLCPPGLYQAALADFIREGHFARHIRRTRALYAERRSALVEALRREFGGRLQVSGDQAGMHLTVLLPEGMDDRRIAARAAERNLWLWPLSPMYLGEGARPGLILGYGSTKAPEMRKAVGRLAALVGPGSGSG